MTAANAGKARTATGRWGQSRTSGVWTEIRSEASEVTQQDEVTLHINYGELSALYNALLLVRDADASNPTFTRHEASVFEKIEAVYAGRRGVSK